MLRPANRIGDVGGTFAPRIFDQCVSYSEEKILGNTTNLLNHLWRVARIMPLQDLEDATRMLQRWVALDLSGMSMGKRSLSLLSVWHDMLFAARSGLLRFGGGRFLRFTSFSLLLRLVLPLVLLFFCQFVLPASGIVEIFIRVQARENAFQFLCILEIIAHNSLCIGICLHIFFEVEFILEHVVDQATQECDIRTCADGCVDIGHLRGTREVRIDVNDCCAALLRSHHPTEADRVAFSEVAALNKNAIAIL